MCLSSHLVRVLALPPLFVCLSDMDWQAAYPFADHTAPKHLSISTVIYTIFLNFFRVGSSDVVVNHISAGTDLKRHNLTSIL